MKVAVAVISDDEGNVLITQRPHHTSHGGFWEFPGGKLESDESPEEALHREIKEELGIEILDASFLGEVSHQYSEKTIILMVFKVHRFLGNPSCLEGQLNMEWVDIAHLKHKAFPEANQKIIHLLTL